MRLASREDIPAINAIMNAPEVRTLIGPGEGPLDADTVFDRVVFFIGEHGVIMGEALGDGEYLGLSAFTKEGQGIESVSCHRYVFDHMFFNCDAIRLHATVDKSNIRAARNLKAIGFTDIETLSPRINASLSWAEWALRSRAALDASVELGLPDGTERSERQLLGAFCLTARNGWGGKALCLFNRYAYMNHMKSIIACHPTLPIFKYGDKMLNIMHNNIEQY